jgi:YegS/Rv2252/BmrU family lipid kinase
MKTLNKRPGKKPKRELPLKKSRGTTEFPMPPSGFPDGNVVQLRLRGWRGSRGSGAGGAGRIEALKDCGMEVIEQAAGLATARSMRKVALIENPASGSVSPLRRGVATRAAAALAGAGIEVNHHLIDGPGGGSALASAAIVNGCDAVLVLGGDGTVHEVLQALVGTDVALGVLPLGTANALAANLGLAGSTDKAIRALLDAKPVKVPLGRIRFHSLDGSEECRYFTVAAGVGPDALLMARMNPVLKRRLGYVLYMIEAFRIWASHPFPLFEARVDDGHGGEATVCASQILAVRIRSFGGVLRQLAPGASLHSRELSLVMFRTRSRLSYLRFLLAVVAGRQTFSNGVELITARSVECNAPSGAKMPLYVEADGEVLGQAPMRMEMTTEKLTLLVPQGAQV